MNSHVKKLVEYILDNYPEYIDNLQIQKLVQLLNSEIDKDPIYRYLPRGIAEIVQLVVDDLGCDVVNKIEVVNNSKVFYSGVKFKDHVVINKNDIAMYEFLGASFLKGVTIKNSYLPTSALMGCEMLGIVDLTQVETLGEYNLDYYVTRAEGCKVLLSNKLTTLLGPSVIKFPPKTEVEYEGTMSQLTALVKKHFVIWDVHQRSDFKRALWRKAIKCDDGVWELKNLKL